MGPVAADFNEGPIESPLKSLAELRDLSRQQQEAQKYWTGEPVAFSSLMKSRMSLGTAHQSPLSTAHQSPLSTAHQSPATGPHVVHSLTGPPMAAPGLSVSGFAVNGAPVGGPSVNGPSVSGPLLSAPSPLTPPPIGVATHGVSLLASSAGHFGSGPGRVRTQRASLGSRSQPSGDPPVMRDPPMMRGPTCESLGLPLFNASLSVRSEGTISDADGLSDTDSLKSSPEGRRGRSARALLARLPLRSPFGSSFLLSKLMSAKPKSEEPKSIADEPKFTELESAESKFTDSKFGECKLAPPADIRAELKGSDAGDSGAQQDKSQQDKSQSSAKESESGAMQKLELTHTTPRRPQPRLFNAVSTIERTKSSSSIGSNEGSNKAARFKRRQPDAVSLDEPLVCFDAEGRTLSLLHETDPWRNMVRLPESSTEQESGSWDWRPEMEVSSKETTEDIAFQHFPCVSDGGGNFDIPVLTGTSICLEAPAHVDVEYDPNTQSLIRVQKETSEHSLADAHTFADAHTSTETHTFTDAETFADANTFTDAQTFGDAHTFDDAQGQTDLQTVTDTHEYASNNAHQSSVVCVTLAQSPLLTADGTHLTQRVIDALDASVPLCTPQENSFPFAYYLDQLINTVKAESDTGTLRLAHELANVLTRKYDSIYAKASTQDQIRRSYLVYETLVIACLGQDDYSTIASSYLRATSCAASFITSGLMTEWHAQLDCNAVLKGLGHFIAQQRTALVCRLVMALNGTPQYFAHLPHATKVIEYLVVLSPDRDCMSLLSFLVTSGTFSSLLGLVSKEKSPITDLLLALLGATMPCAISMSISLLDDLDRHRAPLVGQAADRAQRSSSISKDIAKPPFWKTGEYEAGSRLLHSRSSALDIDTTPGSLEIRPNALEIRMGCVDDSYPSAQRPSRLRESLSTFPLWRRRSSSCSSSTDVIRHTQEVNFFEAVSLLLRRYRQHLTQENVPMRPRNVLARSRFKPRQRKQRQFVLNSSYVALTPATDSMGTQEWLKTETAWNNDWLNLELCDEAMPYKNSEDLDATTDISFSGASAESDDFDDNTPVSSGGGKCRGNTETHTETSRGSVKSSRGCSEKLRRHSPMTRGAEFSITKSSHEDGDFETEPLQKMDTWISDSEIIDLPWCMCESVCVAECDAFQPKPCAGASPWSLHSDCSAGACVGMACGNCADTDCAGCTDLLGGQEAEPRKAIRVLARQRRRGILRRRRSLQLYGTKRVQVKYCEGGLDWKRTRETVYRASELLMFLKRSLEASLLADLSMCSPSYIFLQKLFTPPALMESIIDIVCLPATPFRSMQTRRSRRAMQARDEHKRRPRPSSTISSFRDLCGSTGSRFRDLGSRLRKLTNGRCSQKEATVKERILSSRVRRRHSFGTRRRRVCDRLLMCEGRGGCRRVSALWDLKAVALETLRDIVNYLLPGTETTFVSAKSLLYDLSLRIETLFLKAHRDRRTHIHSGHVTHRSLQVKEQLLGLLTVLSSSRPLTTPKLWSTVAKILVDSTSSDILKSRAFILIDNEVKSNMSVKIAEAIIKSDMLWEIGFAVWCASIGEAIFPGSSSDVSVFYPAPTLTALFPEGDVLDGRGGEARSGEARSGDMADSRAKASMRIFATARLSDLARDERDSETGDSEGIDKETGDKEAGEKETGDKETGEKETEPFYDCMRVDDADDMKHYRAYESSRRAVLAKEIGMRVVARCKDSHLSMNPEGLMLLEVELLDLLWWPSIISLASPHTSIDQPFKPVPLDETRRLRDHRKLEEKWWRQQKKTLD